jgi:hypothetical protein
MDNFKKTNSIPKKSGPSVYRYSSFSENNSGNQPKSQSFDPTEIPTIELDNQPKNNPEKGEGFGSKMKKFFTNKKVLIVLAILLIIAALAGAFWFFKNKNKPVATNNEQVIVEKKEVKKIISPLTGVELKDEQLTKRPVTALMIENSPDARPQSGLTEADIVYEAIAEGGVTRFMAVYQESQPNYIGPIRSARSYYIDYALAYQASYGHVGGSPQALQDIKDLGVRDIDQFFNADAYWRITERFAPHNMYTGFDKIDVLNKAKGFTASAFKGFERKEQVPQTPTAKTIDLAISGPLYSPRFDYDATTNSYLRSQAGQPHTDAKSGATISPKVVVALVVPNGNDSDGYHSTYATTGTGAVYVFQDGIVSEGTWSKTDRKSPLVLKDKNGLPMKLNAGQTWVSLVGASSDISYKP